MKNFTNADQNKIRNIPRGWDTAKLGERGIFEVIMGQSPPSSTYNKENQGLPFLQGKMEFGEIFPSPLLYCSKPIKIAEKNDILISVRAPVGDVNISPLKLCIGRGLASIKCNPQKISYLFLFYFMKYKGKKFQNISSGSTFKAIRRNELDNFEILLPSPNEQKKIAEVLSTVDQAIEKAGEAIEKTQKLKRGLLQELLTKGIGHKEFKKTETGGIPKDWDVKKFKDIGNLQYGYTASAIKKAGGIRFIRITDIDDTGKIKWESVPICKIDKNNYEKYRLRKGDILFARIGATTGKAALIDKEIEGVFASYLIRFVRNVKRLDLKYLYFFTQSNGYWLQVHKNREGQLKKGINAKILGNFCIPLPSVPEQQKIAEVLCSIDERLESLWTRKQGLAKIKKGLMEELLTGRKRVRLEA
jgi:type I restriction enzyme S subunit